MRAGCARALRLRSCRAFEHDQIRNLTPAPRAAGCKPRHQPPRRKEYLLRPCGRSCAADLRDGPGAHPRNLREGKRISFTPALFAATRCIFFGFTALGFTTPGVAGFLYG